MGVKLTSGAPLLFPLTSPPPKAEPLPAKALIWKTVTYADRKIIVTKPFPDTIELVAEIVNDILEVPDGSGKPVIQSYAELDQDIKNGLIEIKMSLPDFMSGSVNGSHTKAEFYVSYDQPHPLNRAKVTIERKKYVEIPAWLIRLEFSASKAGPKGLVQLTSAIKAVLPFVNTEKLLQVFRIARLDAAVDLIGCAPLDVIAHVPKPGKRLVYVGTHGRPETVYFFEAKPLLKHVPKKISSTTTHGSHRLTLYERRDYHLQLLLDPPYGKCPVTRAEVTKRWTKDRPHLSDVPHLENFFKGRRIAYASGVPKRSSRAWQQFCYAVFGTGLEKAFWSWFPGPAPKFAKLYENCPGDLVDGSCWKLWHSGLQFTGLSGWIAAAKSEAMNA